MNFIIFSTLALWPETFGLLMPMTKPDGTVDLASVMSHVTVLEHFLGDVTTKTEKMELELAATKKELEDRKNQSAAEINSLKDELDAVKGELELKSKELISLTSRVKNLEMDNSTVQIPINTSVIDSISHDVKTNTANIMILQNASESTRKTINEMNSTVDIAFTQRDFEYRYLSDVTKSLQKAREAMQANFTSTSNDISRTLACVMNVQSQVNTTTSDVSLLKSDLATLRHYVKGLENSTHSLVSRTKNAAFHAYMGSGGLTGTDRALKFNKVLYNNGSGYDSSTGKFTAPVSGAYIFSAQVEMSNSHENTYVRIVQDGGHILSEGYGETTADQDKVDISITTIANVTKGVEVWVVSMNDVHFSMGFTTYFVGSLLFNE